MTVTAKMNSESALSAALAGVVSLAVGWFLATRNKVSKAELEKLERRLDKLEGKTETHVTHEELRRATDDLKEYIRLSQERLRGDIKTLFNAVRVKPNDED